MIFESNIEYQELVGDVTRALKTVKPKDKNPNPKKQGVGGVVPDEDLAVPSTGHSDSTRDMNTGSKNQPKYDGPTIESLENRLCRVLSELATPATLQARPGPNPEINSNAGEGGSGSGPRPIPTTGTEGTSSGKEDPKSLSTPNAAARHATAARAGGKVESDAEEELVAELDPKAQKMKEKGEEISQRTNEAEQTTSGSGSGLGSLL